MAPLTRLIEDREGVSLPNRLQARSFAFLEPELHPERFGHDQDIGEQDHTVEIETLQWLKARLRRQRRVVAEIEEGSGPGPQRAVLRQITPCLAHEPEWRGSPHLPLKRREKRLAVCVHGHESALMPSFARLSSINSLLIRVVDVVGREERIIPFIPEVRRAMDRA